MKSLVASVFFFSACTAANPLYLGPGGQGKPDGATAHDLGATSNDLGTTHHPDLAPICTDGERMCAGAISTVCKSGKVETDRHCPTDGTCAAGYCQPPAAMVGSVEGQECDPNGSPFDGFCLQSSTSLTCQPFITDASNQSLVWVCADAVGPGGIGTSCTHGSECRSGFCGSNGTCFRACDPSPSLGCPQQTNGNPPRCEQVDIDVEGVPLTEYGCVL
ncbi:MAG TPA: hypothetical protein VII38_18040 [Polyangia bacterium]|jgi:hypothetical protein